MSDPTTPKLLWYDIETTGLDEQSDHLLEIAGVVTDLELREVSSRFHYVLKVSAWGLPAMDEVVRKMHSGNGLLDECYQSDLHPENVDGYLSKHLAPKAENGLLVSAGASVHFDLRFVRRILPRTAALLSHRCFDVTSLKTAYRAWFDPDVEFESRKVHRAWPDVQEELSNARKMLRAIRGGAGDE